MTDLEEDIQEILLWRAGLSGHEGELTICFHHQQLFGQVFQRRAKYCCGVLGSNQCRVQCKKQISLLMVKELKAKGSNVIPGHSHCRQCVKKYDNIMEGDQNESYVEQNESDNGYSFETLRKRLNTSLDTMDISPVRLHGVAQHSQASTAKNKLYRTVEVLKASLADAYVLSTDQLASSESVNVISETEQNASELDHLHSLMKEKLTTAMYSEKIQILTFVPDSWSHRYCTEHFNSRQISAFFVAANKMLR